MHDLRREQGREHGQVQAHAPHDPHLGPDGVREPGHGQNAGRHSQNGQSRLTGKLGRKDCQGNFTRFASLWNPV